MLLIVITIKLEITILKILILKIFKKFILIMLVIFLAVKLIPIT